MTANVGEGLRISYVAEREGFEPPIRLPVCRISSAVLSTTQPPLQAVKLRDFSSWSQNEISPCYGIATITPWISPPDPLPPVGVDQRVTQPSAVLP